MPLIEKIGEMLIDLIQHFRRRKVKQTTSEVIRGSTSIRIISERMVNSGLVDCFFIIMVHNGGKKILPHGFKYWSIVGGEFNEILMKRFNILDYRNVIIDKDFEGLVDQVERKKMVECDVSTMDPSELYRRFRYEGLKYVKYFFLKDREYGMWFIMAGTVQPDELMDSIDHEYQLSLSVNKIQNIIKDY